MVKKGQANWGLRVVSLEGYEEGVEALFKVTTSTEAKSPREKTGELKD